MPVDKVAWDFAQMVYAGESIAHPYSELSLDVRGYRLEQNPQGQLGIGSCPLMVPHGASAADKDQWWLGSADYPVDFDEWLLFRRTRLDPVQCLEAFVRLTGEPEEFLVFARRYGRLLECLDPTHPEARPEAGCPFCDHRHAGQQYPATWESLTLWRTYVDAYGSCINLAARRHQGKPGLSEDWVNLGHLDARLIDRPKTTDVESFVLAEFVASQLRMARVWGDFGFFPSETASRKSVRGDAETAGSRPGEFRQLHLSLGLRGALARGLAVVVGQGNIYLCDVCHKPFSTARKPRATGPGGLPIRSCCSEACAEDARRTRQRERYASLHTARKASRYRPAGNSSYNSSADS